MRFKTFLEAMVTASTLPPKVMVRCLTVGQDRVFKISDDNREFGRLKLRRINDDLWCPHNKAEKGFGPFLYDLAIEYATVFGRGVLPATGAAAIYGLQVYNTDASTTVWQRYYETRSDVKKRLHPKAPKNATPWLYCIYTKEHTTISELQNMNKLTFVNQQMLTQQ